jgi:hypothetical protein
MVSYYEKLMRKNAGLGLLLMGVHAVIVFYADETCR